MKEKQIIRKAQKNGIDIAEILRRYEKTDPWEAAKGILPKKPTGLQHQRRMRKEWV